MTDMTTVIWWERREEGFRKRIAELEAHVRTLREALCRAEQDVNWMLNEERFLNPQTFDYIEAALAMTEESK